MSINSEDLENLSKRVINKNLTTDDIKELPEVRRRIRALMKLQFNKLKVDGDLEKEILELIESEFRNKYDEIYAQRRNVINGSVEPTDEECDSEYNFAEFEPNIEVKTQRVKGIPGFWLRAMLNSQICEWIAREDDSALICLNDIVVNKTLNPSKLILEFHFGTNEFFENEVLTKEYELEFGPDVKNVAEIDCIYPIKRKGCAINWKEDNSLEKYIKLKAVPTDIHSFFCFFNPPEEPKEKTELEADLEDYLWEDWQLGLIIAKKLVPNAVLYYTGDLNDDQTDSESDSQSSESDSSSE